MSTLMEDTAPLRRLYEQIEVILQQHAVPTPPFSPLIYALMLVVLDRERMVLRELR